jgi:2-(1,2-epoxy-1,2-dihydrophenyl)acetyl-CoA isomerase
MSAPLVTYAVDGPVSIVCLNRPDKLNAISPELKRLLVERFHEADRDPATRVVVLRAEGRSFCAGYDIGPSPARPGPRGAGTRSPGTSRSPTTWPSS